MEWLLHKLYRMHMCIGHYSIQTMCIGHYSIQTMCIGHYSIQTMCIGHSIQTMCIGHYSIQTMCIGHYSIQTMCIGHYSIQTMCIGHYSIQTMCIGHYSIQTMCIGHYSIQEWDKVRHNEHNFHNGVKVIIKRGIAEKIATKYDDYTYHWLSPTLDSRAEVLNFRVSWFACFFQSISILAFPIASSSKDKYCLSSSAGRATVPSPLLYIVCVWQELMTACSD